MEGVLEVFVEGVEQAIGEALFRVGLITVMRSKEGAYPEKVEDSDEEERKEGVSEGEPRRVGDPVADFERMDSKEPGSLLQSLVRWGSHGAQMRWLIEMTLKSSRFGRADYGATPQREAKFGFSCADRYRVHS